MAKPAKMSHNSEQMVNPNISQFKSGCFQNPMSKKTHTVCIHRSKKPNNQSPQNKNPGNHGAPTEPWHRSQSRKKHRMDIHPLPKTHILHLKSAPSNRRFRTWKLKYFQVLCENFGGAAPKTNDPSRLVGG